MTDWGRVAIRVDQAPEALGHRMFEAVGAVFVSNPDAGDTPQAMYAAMGFRHVATKRRYVRYPQSDC